VFGSLMLAAAIAYAGARNELTIVLALAVLGCGIGPTLVSQYNLAARLSPAGRSATTMTMLGSAVVVGQAVSSAVTGAVVDRLGSGTALALPAVTAAFVVAAGLAHAVSTHHRRPVPA
jgi:MFS family permease